MPFGKSFIRSNIRGLPGAVLLFYTVWFGVDSCTGIPYTGYSDNTSVSGRGRCHVILSEKHLPMNGFFLNFEYTAEGAVIIPLIFSVQPFF